MLGAVLERVTGMPLPQLFVEWVARPLGLGNTAFHATDAANLATPYYNTPQGPQRMPEGLRVALPEGMAGAKCCFHRCGRSTPGPILPAARAWSAMPTTC